MGNQSDRKFWSRAGYMMAELLVAFAIIGMILTTAIPALGNLIDQSALVKTRMDLQMIDNAILCYATTIGSFPEKLTIQDLAEQGFLGNVPQPPKKVLGFSLGMYELDHEINQSYITLFVDGSAIRFYSSSNLTIKNGKLLVL